MNDPGGTETVFNDSGSWADTGTTFETLFGIDTSWHVVTSNQIAAAATHTVSFDRIRLASGAEPPPEIIAVDPDLSAGELDIRFQTVEGRRYQIERSTDLATWTELGIITASEAITTFTDTDADGGQHFYRLRLL